MIIKISVRDPNGLAELIYDDSKDPPIQPDSSHGDPPVDELTLHGALAELVAGSVRKGIQKGGDDECS